MSDARVGNAKCRATPASSIHHLASKFWPLASDIWHPFSRLWPLASGLFFLLASCQSGDELDLNTREQTDLQGAELIDTFSVKGSTIAYPYVATETGTTLTVGQTTDIRTGTTTATAFVSLGIENTTFGPLVQPTNDSLILYLPFQVRSPGPATVTFNLYNLTESFSPARAYFSNDRLATETTPVATATVVSIDTIKRDRFVKLVFSSAYSRQLIDYLATNGFKGDADVAFQNLLRGFEVRATTQGNTVITSDLSLVRTSGQALTQLKYSFQSRDANGNPVQKDTAINLTIGTRRFSRFDVDRNGSEIISSTNPVADTLTSQSGRVYIQNGAPLWAYLKVPGIESIKKDLNRIAVIKAELVLQHDYPAYVPRSSGVSLLAFTQDANAREMSRNEILDHAIEDESSNTSGSINFFNDSTAGSITINVTRYVQNVINGKQANNGFYVSLPIAERTLLPLTFTTDPANSKRIKLKLYFVRLSTGL